MSGSHVKRKGYAMVKIVCWNIDTNKSGKAWGVLERMRDDEQADIALLQEVNPKRVPDGVDIGPHTPWDRHPYDRWPAVVELSDRVEVKWFEPVPLDVDEAEDKIAVSDLPTLAAAQVTPLPDGEPFIVVSMYARCYWPHPTAREAQTKPAAGVIKEFADASAHRIISDISGFIANTDPSNHRIIAAGDLNTIYGAREESKWETPVRAQTIFDRMDAIGMEFVGPRAGDGSRKADPSTDDTRPSTCNVPTFRSGNQLDYVFASRGLDESVRVRAMNRTPDEWGPSDHCRIVIEVG